MPRPFCHPLPSESDLENSGVSGLRPRLDCLCVFRRSLLSSTSFSSSSGGPPVGCQDEIGSVLRSGLSALLGLYVSSFSRVAMVTGLVYGDASVVGMVAWGEN